MIEKPLYTFTSFSKRPTMNSMKRPQSTTDKNISWKIIIAPALCLALGTVAGFTVGSRKPDLVKPFVLRENSDDYKFINPILVFTIGDKENFPEYKPLEKTITSYINTAISSGKATNVSVYFRNLTNETWTGVNENDTYSPASMLKVAVLIAYLKLSEDNPSILQKTVAYTHGEDSEQYFKPKTFLSTGMRTNEELLKSMIDESDNTSLVTLLNELNDSQKETLNDIYKDLSISVPTSGDDENFMSARTYSRLFRVLYNGTYLSKTLSEKALSLLSDTDFDVGLAAGLPSSTTISHKFGERTLTDPKTGAETEHQLHDCGIIYKPDAPYFLCIMTRGKSFSDLQSILAGISDLVYKSDATETVKNTN